LYQIINIMKNFLLIFVAILLIIPFGTIGIVYALFTVRPLSPYWRGIAESIDQMGNHICGPIFNQWLLLSEGYPFGNIDETVSSVLGKNKVIGTLSPAGKWLDKILDWLDKDHSINAIEKNP